MSRPRLRPCCISPPTYPPGCWPCAGESRFEERFFELLKQQSSENLAAPGRHIREARKEIHVRMEMVNESLAEAAFNPGTHLQIEVSDRQLPDVRGFREQLQQVLV